MTIKQRIDRAERDSLRLLAERRPEDYKALILARLDGICKAYDMNPASRPTDEELRQGLEAFIARYGLALSFLRSHGEDSR